MLVTFILQNLSILGLGVFTNSLNLNSTVCSDCSWLPKSHKEGSEVKFQFSPEPLANKAVDVKVEAGVENNKDTVEVSDTEPDGGDWVSVSLSTDLHSAIFMNYLQI